MKAVIWTDVFQAVVLLGGVIAVLIAVSITSVNLQPMNDECKLLLLKRSIRHFSHAPDKVLIIL